MHRAQIARMVSTLMIAGMTLPIGAQQPIVPPPPPAPYDPIPGPFIVAIDDEGSLRTGADEYFDYLLARWAGPSLSAFSVCFRSTGAPINWRVALRALDAVSQALKAKGAAVVMPAARTCDGATRIQSTAPYIEVTGVIRG